MAFRFWSTPRDRRPRALGAGDCGRPAPLIRFSAKPCKPEAFVVPQWPRLLKLKRQEDTLLFAKCLGHTESPCVAEAVAQLPEARGVEGRRPEARVGHCCPAGLGRFAWTREMSSVRSALGGGIPALDLRHLAALPSPPSTEGNHVRSSRKAKCVRALPVSVLLRGETPPRCTRVWMTGNVMEDGLARRQQPGLSAPGKGRRGRLLREQKRAAVITPRGPGSPRLFLSGSPRASSRAGKQGW